MKCKRCNAPLLMNGVCSRCGLDKNFIDKCIRTSNYYYNRGLDKAIVRDLTGAVFELKKALKYNKHNIDARNLLGLCYHEMGEVVSALTEWVVSQNFQPENNVASTYIHDVQKNPKKLDDVNATIRKYNQTLNYLRQGDFDLALIQLKRVLGMSPNYVNGYLLLALLYIKTDNIEKARKALKRVLRIDTNNTLALKYYKEVGGNISVFHREDARYKTRPKNAEPIVKPEENRERKIKQKEIEPSNQLSIDQYVESSNNKYTFVGILVGLLVGIAVMWFLIIPQKTLNLSDGFKEIEKEYQEEIANKNKNISELENTVAQTEKKKNQLAKELEKATENFGDGNIYENLMYASKYMNDSDMDKAAEYLMKVKDNEKDLELKSSQMLFSQLSEKILPQMAKNAYNKGYSQFSVGDYKNAIDNLTKAFEYDDTNADALYYIGRSYQYSKENAKAKKIYKQVIKQFPDHRRAAQVETNIKEMEEEADEN